MNLKQSIAVIAILILALLAVYFVGKKSTVNSTQKIEQNTNATTSGDLVAEETFYDFGSISMKNGNVSHMFSVKNNSAENIEIEKITTSCMCTEAFVANGDQKIGPYGMPGHGGFVPKANLLISAGETKNIEVVFDPNAHGPAGIGKMDRVVFLQDKNGKTLQLGISAVVTP